MIITDEDYFDYAAENCVESMCSGIYEDNTVYKTKEEVLEDYELYEYMLKTPNQWLDLGYLVFNEFNSYNFTGKVTEDRHILIRLMQRN